MKCGDLPTTLLPGQNQGEAGRVPPSKRTVRSLQYGAHMYQGNVRSEQAGRLKGELVGAPGVNASEDRYVAGGDRRAPAEMLAPDVYKVGIVGEGYGECRAIHRVPGCLELANDALEGSSIGG